MDRNFLKELERNIVSLPILVFLMFILKKPADKEKLKKNSRKLYQANSGAGN